jgi:hypothetical protein
VLKRFLIGSHKILKCITIEVPPKFTQIGFFGLKKSSGNPVYHYSMDMARLMRKREFMYKKARLLKKLP